MESLAARGEREQSWPSNAGGTEAAAHEATEGLVDPFVHPYGSTIKCHDQCSTKPIAKMMSGHGALDGCITLCVMANP